MKVCAAPGCPALTDTTYCTDHTKQRRKQSDQRRPNAAQRGYDAAWRRKAKVFLDAHPTCVDCGAQATVPDHDPVTRAELVARADPDPDAWHHLVARCTRCHNKRTARESPAGWNQ